MLLKKPSVLLIPVMSKLHKKKALEVTRKVRNLFRKELKVLGPKKPVFDLGDFSKIKVRNLDFDVGVVFVGSGGTSKIVADIALNKDWFILAYDKNNSLPSALSAKEKMVSMGGWKGKLAYTDLQKVPDEIVNTAYVSQILKLLKKVRIGVFDKKDQKLRDSIEFVKKCFQVKVSVFPLGKLLSTVREVQVKNVENELNKKIGRIKIHKVSKKDLVEAFRLYLALKKIIRAKNLSCVTFDCFEYLKSLRETPCLAFSLLNNEGFQGVCENEVLYAPLMFIMANLTKRPVWIANLAKISLKDNTVMLTHCTAATKLSDGKRNVLIKPHFESGLSVSLDVPLERGFVTLAHLRLNPPSIVIAEGCLLKSQIGLRDECRTQAYIKLDGNLQKFVKLTGNHHVVGYGKHASALALIAERIGLAYYTT